MGSTSYRFNRLELAGSLGDLGTLLPLALGLILVNGLDATGLLFAVGLYYLLSGIYFGLTVPVQPMKVVAAYAIGTGLSTATITASGFLICIVLLVIGVSGAINWIGRHTPHATVRGVQLSTGVLLISQGVRFIIGTSEMQQLQQAVEPYLRWQQIGPVPIGIVIGICAFLLILLLLENRRLPAGLVVVVAGLALGLTIGTGTSMAQFRLEIHLPRLLPFGWPSGADFSLALLLLVLPQIPMTLGNAVIAYVDLSKNYFKDDAKKVTYKRACISMALANLFSCLIGGMPLCHGAGGLAAHYRFGARTAGSNVMIGIIFVVLALFLGEHAIAVAHMIPLAVLGILLVFAGGQLALTILDVRQKNDLFVALMMLGITLGANLAIGFVVGIVLAYLLRSKHVSI